MGSTLSHCNGTVIGLVVFRGHSKGEKERKESATTALAERPPGNGRRRGKGEQRGTFRILTEAGQGEGAVRMRGGRAEAGGTGSAGGLLASRIPEEARRAGGKRCCSLSLEALCEEARVSGCVREGKAAATKSRRSPPSLSESRRQHAPSGGRRWAQPHRTLVVVR